MGAESSVDDLGTGLGVVSSRAATILRSIETHPLTGRFVEPCFNTLFFFLIILDLMFLSDLFPSLLFSI